jgi:DNA-binding transcriptional LysR family regulator
MATSPLSRRIQDLEKSLGVTLFERSSHSVALTPFGRRMVPVAEDIVSRFDGLYSKVVSGEPAVFEIGHTSTTPHDLVTAVADAVRDVYPNSRINLVCGRETQLLTSILQASIDLSLMIEPPPDPRFSFLRLRTWHTGVLMHCNHPLAGKNELKLADFTDAPFVLTGSSRAPSITKVREAQLVAAGIHDIYYTDDVLEVMWKVSHQAAYGIDVVEYDAPIRQVSRAFSLCSRLAQGLHQISHTSLVWSVDWAQRNAPFADVLEKVRATALPDISSAAR